MADIFKRAAREEDRGAQGALDLRGAAPKITHTVSIRTPYAFHTLENGLQRLRSRRLDIGWKATPTCASQ
jgi:hypothetical protein